MTQLDLFAARRNRQEAIAQVEAHAPPDWHSQARDALRRVCETRQTFIVDALWQHVGKPPEARAAGALIQAAVRAGWCERTERFEPSAQPGCHANPRRVWRSRIYGGAA